VDGGNPEMQITVPMKWNAKRIESRRSWAANGNCRVHWPEEIFTPPSKEVICAVIVTYHPDDGLFSRTERVARQVGQVVVVDNGSPDSSVSYLRRLSEKLQAHLILNAANEGIASAMNQGARWAGEQAYKWVLFFDQDTETAEDLVKRLCEAYYEYPERDKLAVIGSNYKDAYTGRLVLEQCPSAPHSWEEAKTVITSGSLVALEAYEMNGPFRDDFFIDCVDLDYCLRARAKGLRVILSRKAVIEHTIGRTTMHRLPWKETGTSNHSPLRRYYMMRNHIVLIREYSFKEPLWALSTLWSRLKSTILMCLFEKNRRSKLKYTALGFLDGVACNFNRWVA
jgi:rhamnosyltransferase